MPPPATNNPPVTLVGSNPTRLWGITAEERLRRIALADGLATADGGYGAGLLVSAHYAFDRQWLGFMCERPGAVLTLADRPVIAHLTAPAIAVRQAMERDVPAPIDGGLTVVRVEDNRTFHNQKLRKREKPFIDRLEPGRVPSLERQSYFGAYKGVTDLLTKYLWPEWALALTRIAVRIGISPNGVTAIGAALCLLATWLFAQGDYWAGLAAGLGFMVLDTVDGKLARCTIRSSWWGNIFDHGIDLIHPPFWWWAWGAGLANWGLAVPPDTFTALIVVIFAGYIVQRLIEGIFIRRFGIDMHTWARIDSDFRLITARRNPNMVILFASLLVARPDLGLIAVAGWTLLSLVFHAVRLAMAWRAAPNNGKLNSWLAEAA